MRIKVLRILFVMAFVSTCAITGNAQDTANVPAAESAATTAPGESATTDPAAAGPADGAAATAPAATVSAAKTPVVLSPKKIQANMREYMTINEHHELLKSLEGRWMVTTSYWMDPADAPQVSEGISQAVMIMNGKFLEQTFNGTAMGQPFEGRGIMGYDNLKKEYTSVWFDNMATGIMMSSGQYNPETKVLSLEGSLSCPITQEARRWMREALTIKDVDNYTYESFMKDKDGKEYRAMEIVYKRVK